MQNSPIDKSVYVPNKRQLINNPGWHLLLMLCIAIISVGCSDKTADSNSIRFALSSYPSNLDPRFATDASSERINQLLYSRLVKFDENLLPQPSLARWQKLSPVKYRFVLLPDRPKFSNGKRVTAQDVAASYRFVLDKTNLSPHREAIALIHKIDVVDDETIEFSLSRADPLFPAYLNIAVLPDELVENRHQFNLDPIGSGPFKLYERNVQQNLILERRLDGQRIEFLQVKDPTVRVLKLLNKEVDILQNDLSPEIAGYLQRQPGITHLKLDGSNFTYIGFNLADPVTGNLNIRKAISHAINRESIIEYAFNQAARPAESILPPTHWAGHDGLQSHGHNILLARQYLGQAGYSEKKRLQLTYKTSSDPFRIKLATIIKSQLAEIGIDLKIKSYDWGTFFGDIKSGRFQMYSLSWVGINTPDIFNYVFHSSSIPPAGANRGRYHSEELDQLLEDVLLSATLDDQILRYREIQEILHKELPYIPLWYESQLAFVNSRISGYKLSTDGNFASLSGTKIETLH